MNFIEWSMIIILQTDVYFKFRHLNYPSKFRCIVLGKVADPEHPDKKYL